MPITRDEIGRRLADGRLTLASLVSEDGRWRPLREMSGFDEIARSIEAMIAEEAAAGAGSAGLGAAGPASRPSGRSGR